MILDIVFLQEMAIFFSFTALLLNHILRDLKNIETSDTRN